MNGMGFRSSSEAEPLILLLNDDEDAGVEKNGTDPLHQQQVHDEPDEHLQKSCWETDATPMTSRPHFHKDFFPQSPSSSSAVAAVVAASPAGRRLRAVSLGAETDLKAKYVHPIISPEKREHLHLIRPFSEERPVASPGVSISISSDHQDLHHNIIKSPVPQQQSLGICTLYGIINASIVLPVLTSFASIIYRDPFFIPYMPVLVQLTILSGLVHQLCFCAFSSLPFAIGQVQDAGLIFLSTMASSMVKFGTDRKHSDDTILATVTVSLAICTAVLGCGLILIGRLQLAQYVQRLPTCVVGGYLAYIGWFCGMAGVGICAQVSKVSFMTVFEHADKVAPGMLGGLLIYGCVRRFQHMSVLPTCIVLLLLLFYAVLWMRGASIHHVTQTGWIRKMDRAPSISHTWDYLKLDKVDWSILPTLIGSELSMTFIVALSSSLDVAAIELELNQPLDYNHELMTVGVSNVISGLSGGYTGSYIFSQSIFSLRAGIRSRVAGLVLAACQLMVLISPYPILQFIPNFLFASLLSMICVDLMYEWLWDVRRTITRAEYCVCLATFVLIQCFGVEWGILAGVLLYIMSSKFGMDVGNSKIAEEGKVPYKGENGTNYGSTTTVR